MDSLTPKTQLVQTLQKTLLYYSFKSRLKKVYQSIEFEKSREKNSTVSTDLESLESFEIFSNALLTNKTLETLNLSSTNLPDLNLIKLSQSLAKNNGLLSLDLSNNLISSLGFKYLFRMLKENNHLININLFNNEIQKENIEDIRTLLAKNKSINELNLNFCGLDHLSVRALLEALNGSHIKKIRLSKNFFDSKSFHGLGIYLSNMFLKLEVLDFAYNICDSNSLNIIKANLKKIPIETMKPLIQEINMMGNKLITPDSVESLKSILKGIRGIQNLNLSKTFLNHVSLNNLARSFKRVHHSLNISNNVFKNCLPELHFFYHLKHLNLSKTNLYGESIKQICNALIQEKNNILWENLDLSYNKIDNENIIEIFNALKKNKSLISLNVSGNCFDEEAFQDFDIFVSFWSLKELNMGKNPFKNVSFLNVLFNLPNDKTSLEALYINNIVCEAVTHKNSSIFLKEIKDFKGVENIKKLTLANSLQIGTPIIKNLIFFENICELDLENCCLLRKDRLENIRDLLTKTNTLKSLSLKNLYLGRLNEKELEILGIGFETNKTLTSLNLSKNKLDKKLKVLMKSLCLMKTLKSLDLSNNYLTNRNSDVFTNFLKECCQLEVLDLSNNLISFITIDKICALMLKNIDTISLKDLRLANISFSLDCLISIGFLLQQYSKLKNLDISNNELVKINTATLYNKSNKETIKEMNLCNTSYDRYQYRFLVKLLMDNPIETLDLSGSRFLEGDLTQFIKKTAALDTLNILDISFVALKDFEIADLLIRLKNHKRLHHIKLNLLEIKQKSSNALCQLLKHNSTLEILDLSDNHLSQEFFKDLKEGLMVNESVQSLLLKKTKLNDQKLITLGQSFEKNITLKHLDIRNNNISIFSLETLMGFLNISGSKPKKGLETLLLSDNNLESKEKYLEFSFLNFSQLLKANNSLISLDFSNTFFNKPSEISSLTEALKSTTNLSHLALERNNLGISEASFISKLILSCQNLQVLSLAENNFGSNGLEISLEHLDKNLTLKQLNISKNIRSVKEGLDLCKFLFNKVTSKYLQIEMINISDNFIREEGNKILLKLLKENENLFLLNTHWEKVRNEIACQILLSLQRFYHRKNSIDQVEEGLRHLDFSDGKLDDDFCIYFSHHIHEYLYLETLDISKNKKITLIGLKFIYVYLKFNVGLKKIYFKEYSYDSVLNNGIATSCIHWCKYSHYKSRIIKFVQKIALPIFSKMQMIPNRFQYNESFTKFFAPIKDGFIFLFFLTNFCLQIFLALFLPIYYVSEQCGGGQDWNSHIIYGAYLVVTFFFELIFLIQSRRKIISNIIEKDLKREEFMNDMINLVGGILLRFDTYTDVCFLTIAYKCNTDKIFFASLIVVIIKLIVKFIQNIRTLYKLIKSIRKHQKIDCLNLYAKLCCFQSMPLTNDILDRYCPGNAKRINHILCKKLRHSIYLNIFILDSLLKFALEDIPQTILQSLFLFYKQDPNKNDNYTNTNNWIIWFSVLKNCCSLIGSFYSMVSFRPSYIEQSDFDECLTVQKVFKGQKEDFGFGLSLLKRLATNKKDTKISFVKIATKSINMTASMTMSKANHGTFMYNAKQNNEEESDLMIDVSEDIEFEKEDKISYLVEPQKWN